MSTPGAMRGWILATVVAATAAARPIRDPQMGLDSGSLSDPISTSTVFVPDSNGGGAFGFYNNTGSFITELVFGTTILPGLTSQQLSGVFSCNDQNTPVHPNPFFLNCAIFYTPASGQLKIAFYGVRANDNDPNDAEINEHEGIPPILARCQNTPDAPGCRLVGHFIVTLNDGYGPSPTGTGGWTTSATPGVFLAGGPVFGVLEIDTAPEPGTAALAFAALIGLAAADRARRRRLRR
jgi:hypothetical protein